MALDTFIKTVGNAPVITLLMLMTTYDTEKRFTTIGKDVDFTQVTLMRSLNAMVAQGLATREARDEFPRGVYYKLTDRGASIGKALVDNRK